MMSMSVAAGVLTNTCSSTIFAHVREPPFVSLLVLVDVCVCGSNVRHLLPKRVFAFYHIDN